MNEFTKDELQIILLEMNIVIQRTKKEGALQISPIFFELREKIQSMIDNYCDHMWTSVGNHEWLHCIVCKENFNYV